MKSIVFIVIFFSLISCKESNDKVVHILQNAIEDFNEINNKHNIQSEILSILNFFVKSETFKTEYFNSSTILTEGSFELIFDNGELTSVKNVDTTYEIKDVRAIDVIYTKGEITKKGSLNSGVYNGTYMAAFEDFLLEVHLEKGDSLLLKETYSNGNLKREVKFHDGYRNGVYVEYYSNKIKKIECNYLNNLKEGFFLEWFDNGKLKTKVNYNEGIKIGEQIKYYKDVLTMQSKSFYKNGKRDGLAIAWFPNAKSKFKALYKKGKLHGEAVVYHENENIMKMKGNYSNGMKNGVFNVWNENGIGIFSSSYEHDELVKIIKGTLEEEIYLVEAEDLIMEEN